MEIGALCSGVAPLATKLPSTKAALIYHGAPAAVVERDDEINNSKSTLISSELELEELAEGIAQEYIGYLRIDVTEQKRKSEESIEECLTHLEEVCSVLDNYRQNSDELSDIVKEIAGKRDRLERLYDQIDALDQYIFEINKSLDQLDLFMKELQTHKSFSGNNRIKQIIDLLPRISLNSMPRLNLFNSFTGFIGVEATGASFLDEQPSTSTINNAGLDATTSISEILAKVSNIETSITESTSSLEARLNIAKSNNPNETNSINNNHQQLNKPSLDTLNCDSPEQVDGSWQELL